jgi:hypothetical protein
MGAGRFGWGVALALLLACGGDGGGEGSGTESGSGSDSQGSGTGDTGGPPSEPVPVDPSEYSFRLEQSTPDLLVWTTPATRKLTTADVPPEEARPALFMSAARSEFEPLQFAIGPGSGDVAVSVAPFEGLAGAQVELASVEYVDGWGELLQPLAQGGNVSRRADASVGVWITVRVPDDAAAGEHATTVTLAPTGGSPIEIPLTLYVFDFSLPPEINFATQLNVDVSSLIPDGGSVDDAKNLLYGLRFTPKSVTWPSGFGWSISWDNQSSTAPCEILWDEPDEPDEYSIGWLARRYILGEGWNGVGFPNAMLFQFVDNSTPRPDSLCGIARGDHYGTDEFNAEWSQWLGALEVYLADAGMLDKAYYYVQNEPQNEEDERLANHLCRLTKAAAPGLRIAISEEPKPEIAEHPDGPCGYDIWIAHVQAYAEDYAKQRQLMGETVWFYSLDQDPDPFFNPTRVDVQGMHQRVIPWAAWIHRIRGWAYYDGGRFFDGPRPTVRAALFREGHEDYEYLWLANERQQPVVDVEEPVDATVRSIASSMKSWNHDPDQLMVLRHELGRFLEGSRATLPVIEDSDGRPVGEYYINFQDPQGSPTAEPLVVDGKTYLKVGWTAYDADLGYGWYGENIDDPSIALFGYDDVAGASETQRSYIYDDYGRPNLFEFDLAAGTYDVTIGVGRPSQGSSDPHNVTVEGTVIVDDEPTTDAAPTIVRTTTVELTDGSLSIEFGGRSEATGDFAYTFIGFVDIVPTP